MVRSRAARMVVAAFVATPTAACGSSTKPVPKAISNSAGAASIDGSVRVIARRRMDGVLELHGDRAKAMDAAKQEMTAHCGPNQSYRITQEGEEVFGTDTSGRTVSAWRVHYECVIDI